ncbi:MAG: pilin [Candidatus Taylorbacteria bacterium]|nr:pilin [Candidatus Taylorbacteria bacterium]
MKTFLFKKRQIIIRSFSILLLVLVLLPFISFGAIVNCGNSDPSECNFYSITRMVNEGLKWFMGISISVVTISFAIAGGMMLLNPGDSAKRSKAKEVFKNTIIGLIIVLTAYLIVYTVLKGITNPDSGVFRFLKDK